MTSYLRGAEPFFHDAGPNGVLVLHGFTSVPGSMSALAQRLAREGFSVAQPLLPGHGTTVADLQAVGFPEWLAGAEEAFDAVGERCERVAVVGMSMGGTLAATMASTRDDVAAVVFINPQIVRPVTVADGLESLLDAGVETYEPIGGDIKKEGPSEPTLEQTPLRPLKTLFDALPALNASLHHITAPSLLFSSREDHLVASTDGDVLASAVGGSLRRIWLENSYHVATLDNDAELIENETVAFLVKEMVP